MNRGKTIAMAGLGGVGSYLAPLLPRFPLVQRVLLADHDRYGPENLPHQAIGPADVGQNKAEAQAIKLRAIRADLAVLAMPRRIENVPLGLLDCDLLISAVDSRRVRVAMNQLSLKLGSTLLDIGVNPHTGRVRVALLRPGPASACLQCTMQERDYQSMETIAPCQGAPGVAPPSRVPVALSAMASALAAQIVQEVLSDRNPPDHIGTQWVMDLATLQTRQQNLGRAPCRTCLADHHSRLQTEVVSLDDLGHLALGELFRNLGDVECLTVEGASLVQRAWCPTCGSCQSTLHLSGRVESRCLNCGGMMRSAESQASLAVDELSPEVLVLPLITLGIGHGDVLALRGASGATRHVVLRDRRCDWDVFPDRPDRAI